jgi:hypothetical protein
VRTSKCSMAAADVPLASAADSLTSSDVRFGLLRR